MFAFFFLRKKERKKTPMNILDVPFLVVQACFTHFRDKIATMKTSVVVESSWAKTHLHSRPTLS